MKLTLMFTGSEDLLRRCRQPRHDVMELVSAAIDVKDYGATLACLRVNVVFQDADMIELGVDLSRQRKDISIDVELSREWVKNASDAEIKAALLDCLVRAVEVAKQRLTRKEDDFDAGKLAAELNGLANEL
jgi:hypothetical protein